MFTYIYIYTGLIWEFLSRILGVKTIAHKGVVRFRQVRLLMWLNSGTQGWGLVSSYNFQCSGYLWMA